MCRYTIVYICIYFVSDSMCLKGVWWYLVIHILERYVLRSKRMSYMRRWDLLWVNRGNVAKWMFNRSLWMLVEVVLSRSKSIRTEIDNFTFKWIWERLFEWVFHKLNITFHIEYKFKEIFFPLFSFWVLPKELFYRSSLQVIRSISPKTYQNWSVEVICCEHLG